MAVLLYQHNSEAYEAAVKMLKNTGKAAVIHPTGTGKSFLGFKLCEDHPDKTICWLSPSRYIFETQLDNLASAADGYRPQNIWFCTYARLMNLSEEELAAIDPGYIVMDEFHRCGASKWGQGVARLLRHYPKVPLLGLSATAIRYLDNQRDMSDELFDGHIASQMTLGEAIVRGILNPPRYVLSLYSYKGQVEKIGAKIQKLQNNARREQAEEYLEQLRRTLDKAEGLDQIFYKHMTDRRGKYLVFCTNFNAMQDALDKIPEWFRLVDTAPHVYTVYAEDPASVRSFEAFRTDNDRNHLRLLFCIDALNEGVHVEDISGVILLRPTVSPIIFKQQIGRALSASRRTEPVIFDVVNNIENLYSIDAIKEEMDTAAAFLRETYGEKLIINETFRITDELQSCRELFRTLEERLTASWDVMYQEAKNYYAKQGDLVPPIDYITPTGHALGRWLYTQRINYAKHDPSLTETRIQALEAIGMNWSNADERTWVGFYKAAKAYYKANKNLDVPTAYHTGTGLALGRWIRAVKDKYAQGRLPDERCKALEAIGMRWEASRPARWNDFYEQAEKYYQEHQDLNIPADYITRTEKGAGQKLGAWISAQRVSYSKGRLTDDQIARLEAIGMCWDRYQSKWEQGYEYCRRYIQEHGDINTVPVGFTYDDFKLLTWIRTQRNRKRAGKLSQDRIEKLEAIGLEWDVFSALWEKGYLHAVEYKEKNGNMQVAANYVCPDGFRLKTWLNNQAYKNKNGKLSEEQKEKLELIGCF